MQDSRTVTIKSRIKKILGSFVFWFFQKISNLVIKKDSGDVTSAPAIVQESRYLQDPLKKIVHDVVSILGYAGAMVATYETRDDALPVRAFYINPEVAKIATEDQIKKWEKEISQFTTSGPISLTDPNIARVYPHQDRYQNNLSVIAFKSGKTEIKDNLFSLFAPIAPKESEGVINFIQELLGIKQVIAVPFFVNTAVSGEPKLEFVGNLFAAKRENISQQDQEVLSSFAHYAASFILSEKRREQAEIIENLILDIQKGLADEKQVLERIVQGVVEEMGYAGAMVATYDTGDDALPVRALYINPEIAKIASENQIKIWEEQASQFTAEPVSLTDPNIARVYPHQDKYKDNLSVIAFKSGKPEFQNKLFSLFTPIAPRESEGLIDFIQDRIGIKQVIAVPFFLDNDFVGNLFVATRSYNFSNWEIDILKAFGQQTAAGLRNVGLYKQSENRRLSAEILGRMAFSAVTAVHEFRNHLAVVRGSIQMIQVVENNPELLQEQIKKMPTALKRIDQMADVLEKLHQPWTLRKDVPVDINTCINYAIGKIVDDKEDWVHTNLSNNLPKINTSQDMLSEAFRVIIKNSAEAIAEKGKERNLAIKSSLVDSNTIEVTIEDNGIGIKKENLSKVFDMRWTTKKGTGLGFGLFWTKDYIEGLGGRIDIQSVWNEGTVFKIHIPLSGNSLINNE